MAVFTGRPIGNGLIIQTVFRSFGRGRVAVTGVKAGRDTLKALASRSIGGIESAEYLSYDSQGAAGAVSSPFGGRRKSADLLYPVRLAPDGGNCLAAMVMRAPPCTRKGPRSLTRIGAKLSFCLWWGR